MVETELLDYKPFPLSFVAEIGAGAPDPGKCRVGGMVRDLNGGWCLVRPTPTCSFGVSIGLGCLCRHPEIQQIIARTQAQKEARAA